PFPSGSRTPLWPPPAGNDAPGDKWTKLVDEARRSVFDLSRDAAWLDEYVKARPAAWQDQPLTPTERLMLPPRVAEAVAARLTRPGGGLPRPPPPPPPFRISTHERSRTARRPGAVAGRPLPTPRRLLRRRAAGAAPGLHAPHPCLQAGAVPRALPPHPRGLRG